MVGQDCELSVVNWGDLRHVCLVSSGRASVLEIRMLLSSRYREGTFYIRVLGSVSGEGQSILSLAISHIPSV